MSDVSDLSEIIRTRNAVIERLSAELGDAAALITELEAENARLEEKVDDAYARGEAAGYNDGYYTGLEAARDMI